MAILALSAYMWWDSQAYLDPKEVGDYYLTPFVVLLILGAIMTIVGFLGCCGALKESRCLLSLVSFIQISHKVGHNSDAFVFSISWFV